MLKVPFFSLETRVFLEKLETNGFLEKIEKNITIFQSFWIKYICLSMVLIGKVQLHYFMALTVRIFF